MTESEGLRLREDDQPLPQPSQGPSIHDLVVEDIRGRQALGLRRYGQPLQAHNGRNALRDAYEEALDLACYLRQLLEEHASARVALELAIARTNETLRLIEDVTE